MCSQYGYTTADGVSYSCDVYNATSSDYIRFDVDMSADSIGDLRDDDDGYQSAADFWTAIDELCVFPDDNDQVTTDTSVTDNSKRNCDTCNTSDKVAKRLLRDHCETNRLSATQCGVPIWSKYKRCEFIQQLCDWSFQSQKRNRKNSNQV